MNRVMLSESFVKSSAAVTALTNCYISTARNARNQDGHSQRNN